MFTPSTPVKRRRNTYDSPQGTPVKRSKLTYTGTENNIKRHADLFNNLVGKGNWAYTGSIALQKYGKEHNVTTRKPNHNIDIVVKADYFNTINPLIPILARI